MSGLFLHAVAHTPRLDPPAPRNGLRDYPLCWIAADDLGVWATVWRGADTAMRRADLLMHHDIIETLTDTWPCLPVRFGTWCGDQREVRRLLGTRYEELYSAIQRVRGRRELVLTLLWRMPPTTIDQDGFVTTSGGAGTGRRFLEQRREAWIAQAARRERATALARWLERELDLAQAEVQHSICPSNRVALSSAMLVPSGIATSLRDQALRISASVPDMRMLVNGPWPPYSFSGVG